MGPPGGYNPPGHAKRGVHALVGCAHPGAPLWWVLAPKILIIDIKNPRKVSFHSENFHFCTKNNTMVVLLKTASVRVSFIQIMQIIAKTIAKALGKVDTTKTYHISTPSVRNYLSEKWVYLELEYIEVHFFDK